MCLIIFVKTAQTAKRKSYIKIKKKNILNRKRAKSSLKTLHKMLQVVPVAAGECGQLSFRPGRCLREHTRLRALPAEQGRPWIP